MFNGKTLLITGGTGSFGTEALQQFLDTDIREIRIFSRDEKKQDDMRRRIPSEKVKYYLGDVRDIASLRGPMQGADFVFHAAALKQVPSCEFFPLEAVKTNILGTDNVLAAAQDAGVSRVICLSTDKAAYPVNAMGASKALMEKVAVARAMKAPEGMAICCTRYGNVLCSRGSVIPLFIEQIRAGQPLTVTDPAMTRFVMTLPEAVELVLFAFEHGRPGDILVKKAPACGVGVLAQAVAELFGGEGEFRLIGMRHGEKMYETLLTGEECLRALDMGDFYRVPSDKRDLNYEKYFSKGDQALRSQAGFNSDNARQLTVKEVKEKLLCLPYIREELRSFGRRGRWAAGKKAAGLEA